MEASLSIVIPVYNGSRHIPQLFDTLGRQNVLGTDTDIPVEVIMVDDGSIDGTPEVIREYVAMYPNVRYLRQENSGQATARNLGLDNARMKYVYMLDCDDILVDDVLVPLVKRIEDDGSEVLRFKYVEVDSKDKGSLPKVDRSVSTMHTHVTDGIGFMLDSDCMRHEMNVWTSIFSVEFLRKRNLRFDARMRTNEDGIFNISVMAVARRVSVCQLTGIYYIVYDDSNSHRRDREHEWSLRPSFVYFAEDLVPIIKRLQAGGVPDVIVAWLKELQTRYTLFYWYAAFIWMPESLDRVFKEIDRQRRVSVLPAYPDCLPDKSLLRPHLILFKNLYLGMRHPSLLRMMFWVRGVLKSTSKK